MSTSTPSPREVLDRLPAYFVPDAAGNAQVTVHLELTGDYGGQWTLRIANRQCQVLDGLAGVPDLVISSTGQDYVQIMNGTLLPMAALIQGRVKFKGDMALALRMQTWFKRPSNGR